MPTNTAMSLAPGFRLGPYEIVAPLGAGGMGEVYRARDTRLGREVAVKVLPPAVVTDPDRLRRFAQEARAASALSHPNLLTVFDLGEQDGIPFLVTELLEGETLRASLLESGALPSGKAIAIALQVCRGLIAAHERGIVHRDLKPENLLLSADGHVKILDFGLAKVIETTAVATSVAGSPSLPLTAVGMVLGTADYMSPEQVRGQPADVRSDLFALGAVLSEMVTGHPVFRRDSAADTMVAILKEDPPRLAASGVAISPALEEVVSRCLAKSLSERFQSARHLALELERIGTTPGAAGIGAAGTGAAGTGAAGIGAASIGAASPGPASPGAAGRGSGASSARAVIAASHRSLAVLPFADMSAARDQDFFCEGMAEELIHQLSRLPGLRVASRTASFQFQGEAVDLRQVGERLGVSSVLEGSVRRAKDQLRITLKLVSVADGYPIWSGRYDRDLRDVFAVQDEIATAVAQALRGVLTELEHPFAKPAPTQSVEAYECYLRGRQFFRRFDRRSLTFAAQMFRRAVEIDPDYALAYAGMADCASFLCGIWGGGEAELLEADEASRRALELAPGLAPTHASRGLALYLNRRYEQAEPEFVTALRLDPDLFEALYFFARMRFEQGRLEESVELYHRASVTRPEDYQAPVLQAMAYDSLGRNQEMLASLRRGLAAAERHLELNPDDARALYLGGQALVRLGQRQRGLEWAQRARELEPNEPIVLYNVAGVYALAGVVEPAVDCLELAFSTGFGRREWLAADSDFVSLRSDARFQRLLAGGNAP